MAGDWDGASAAAMKILGDKGKIPPPKAAVAKAQSQRDKVFTAWKKAKEDLEAKLVEMQDAASSNKNAMQQFTNVLAKDDLGLDSKNKEDAKKIDQARKLLVDVVQEAVDKETTNVSNLDELDKHIENISKYKSPAIPEIS